jgi:pentatricopeptide repeat protein
MATTEAPVMIPAPCTDITNNADHAVQMVPHTSDEGNDAKKIRKMPQKVFRWPSILAVACMIIALFVADTLLLGSPDDDSSTSWFLQAWQKWNFVSPDSLFVLDCCWLLPVMACIIVKLFRSNVHDNKKSTKGITKKPAHKGRRNDLRPATASKPVASNANLAKAAEHQNQRIRSKWNLEIATAARQGDFDKAVRLLLKFESEGEDGCRPDVVSYNLLIHAFAKKGDLKGAEKWLQHLESKGIEATCCSYNSILDACAKAGTWTAAEACERWLERMLDKNVKTNVVSYASVVYAWARRGEQARAEMWMKRMIDSGIKPDEVAYNSVIHACSVSGNPAGAERWMQDMQDRGILASVTTFATVIDACSKGGDLPSAEKWFEIMLDAKVEPNVMTFTSMIDACAKKVDPDRAEYWFNKMVQCNIVPNAHSFSAIINAFAKSKDAAKAEQWLDHAEKVGIQDGVIYSSVLDACGQASDSERAVKVFQRMVDNGIKPTIIAYSALARPFAYRGDWVEVESIAKEMSKHRVRPNEYFLYSQLISYASSKPRQDERAEQCFREAHRLGLKVNDHVVTALSRAVGRSRCSDLMNELCNGRPVPFCVARGGKPGGSKAGSHYQSCNAGGSNHQPSNMPPWHKN